MDIHKRIAQTHQTVIISDSLRKPRASMRLQPGCYTMVEIPVIDMLPGDRADLIEHLV